MFNVKIVSPKVKFYKSYNFSTQDLRYILYVFAVHTVTGTRLCTTDKFMYKTSSLYTSC